MDATANRRERGSKILRRELRQGSPLRSSKTPSSSPLLADVAARQALKGGGATVGVGQGPGYYLDNIQSIYDCVCRQVMGRGLLRCRKNEDNLAEEWGNETM